MTNTKLRTALMQALINAGITAPVQWPNAPFTIPNDAPWLRFTPFLLRRSGYTLNETDAQNLLIQIDVFVPKGSRDIESTGIADQVCDAFPFNSRIEFDSGFIQVESTSARPSSDDTFYRTMIEIRATAYGDRRA